MIAIIQRVKSCNVKINNLKTASIEKGILVFLGIERNDDISDIKYCTNKIINLRIFNDTNDKMNLSVKDINGEVMVVSQFTLCGKTDKGSRPSYISAMNINLARDLYNKFLDYMEQCYYNIKSGTFQAHMTINLINDGPVTLIVRSKN